MAEGSKLVHPAQPGQSFSHHAERGSPFMSPTIFINGDNDIISVEFHDRLAKVGYLILTSPGMRPPAALAGLGTRARCYH